MSGHPWWSWVLQGTGLVLAYAGAELNSRLNATGFRLWIAANAALFLVHVTSGLPLLAILDVIYIRLNFRAIQRWTTARPPTPVVSD
jgi:hypothetical protein